jgi:hypothetical protein
VDGFQEGKWLVKVGGTCEKARMLPNSRIHVCKLSEMETHVPDRAEVAIENTWI